VLKKSTNRVENMLSQ